MTGGASASDKGRDLRGQAAHARAARQSGAKVVRGQSETAFKKQAKAWDAGAVGEERAARQLERLRREGFTVLHDVLLEPGKKWNLDHVVVGRPGILFVDAKMWRGRVSVYKGQLWRHWYGGPKTGKQSENMTREVTKVKGMAAHAAARLGAPVRPVICLAGAKSREFEDIAVIDGVTVISLDRITAWLRDAPERLPVDQVAMWSDIARRVFPAAVADGPVSPQEAEKARWAAAMQTGGAPAFRPTLAPPPPAQPNPPPPTTAPEGRWLGRLRG